VLAGGRSSRMGRDKALLKLGGKTLVERAGGKLKAVCERVGIAGGDELAEFGRVVPDERPGCGPLGGIVAALESSEFEWNIFLPVDVPLVPVEFVQRLGERCLASDTVAVMARVDGRAEPLCAGYHRRALGGLRVALEQGDFKVMRAIEGAGEIEFMDIVEPGMQFLNLNTPEEFAAAEQYLIVAER
jgi:molybdopterin-guanine dinucleotide biosynthesis protein A